MVPVKFWMQLLLLVLVLRQSAADCDQYGELKYEISNFTQNMLTRLTEIEHRNEILKQLQATPTVMKCHIVTGNQHKGSIIGLTMTEEPKNETVEELREKQQHMQAVIDGLTKAEEANNGTIKLLQEKQKQLQETIHYLTNTVHEISRMGKWLCGQMKGACQHLLAAVISGDVNTAKMLVKCTNHNCTTDAYWHYTPLMYAAANDDMEMVRLLLEGGASVDMANDNDKQWTALHVAAWFGHLDMCRLLLDWGANVNVVNWWNNTPLYWAAWAGKLDMVKLLVERGADVRLKNKDGETAHDKARSEGHSDVADWLNARVL